MMKKINKDSRVIKKLILEFADYYVKCSFDSLMKHIPDILAKTNYSFYLKLVEKLEWSGKLTLKCHIDLPYWFYLSFISYLAVPRKILDINKEAV